MNNKKLMIGAMVLFVSAITSLQGVAAETYEAVRASNFRDAPDSSSKALGFVLEGTKVESLGQDGDWMKVKVVESGKVGWMRQAVLTGHTNNTADAAAQAKADATAQAKADATAQAKADATAQAKADATAQAKADATAQAKADAAAQAKADAAAQAKADATAQAKADATAQAKADAAAQAKADAAAQAKADATAQAKADATGQASYQAKSASNFRDGPSSDAKALGFVLEGAKVHKLTQQAGWFKVKILEHGRIGWIKETVLAKTKIAPRIQAKPVPVFAKATPVKEARVVAMVQPQQPVRAAVVSTSGDYQTVKAANFRDAPSISSVPLGFVLTGEYVRELSRAPGWMKIQVIRNGRIGWVDDEVVKPIAVTTLETKTTIKRVAKTKSVDAVPATKASIGAYATTDLDFNYSYKALAEAKASIFIEDYFLEMDAVDAEAVFKKAVYNKSSFPVSIRLKGGKKLKGKVATLGSSTLHFLKKSLIIKIDQGNIHGHKRVAFRAMASDGSMMREWISWKLMKAMGLPVPEVHFARLNINGTISGMFLYIEWLDQTFLQSSGLGTGDFYHPADSAHCGDLSVATLSTLSTCWHKLAPFDGDYTSLRKLVMDLQQEKSEDFDKFTAERLTQGSVTNWIALNTLLSNTDSYIKNYFLHRNANTDKWTILPWDYNMTFGRSWDPVYPYPESVFNKNFQYYYLPDAGPPSPLKNNTLLNPKLKAELYTTLKHLLGLEQSGAESTFGWFSPDVMEARINHLAKALAKESRADQFLAYEKPNFEKEYKLLNHYAVARANFLKLKLFGSWPWQPNVNQVDAPVPPLMMQNMWVYQNIEKQTDSIVLTDPIFAQFVARFELNKESMKKDVEVQVFVQSAQAPQYLPQTKKADECIQRSWLVSVSSPYADLTGDLTLEYLDENSIRNERGSRIRESELTLWALDGTQWKAIDTETNDLANTLKAKQLHITSGKTIRFVACNPS